MVRDGTATKEMQQYFMPKYVQAGKLKGNLKMHNDSEWHSYIPSYITDTIDFTEQLKETPRALPKDVVLLCFDVRKLYPSILRKKDWRHTKKLHQRGPTQLLNQLIMS